MQGPPGGPGRRGCTQAQSEDRLEAFRRQSWRRPSAHPQPSPRQGSYLAAMIDNPKWLDLNRRARRTRAASRRPARRPHAGASGRGRRDGADQELKQQLAGVPRQIAGTASTKGQPAARPEKLAGRRRIDRPAKKRNSAELPGGGRNQAVGVPGGRSGGKAGPSRRAEKAGPRYSSFTPGFAENARRPGSGWQRLMYTTLGAAC